jgi:hypothetical protein
MVPAQQEHMRMIMFAALLALPASGLGAPYPHARLEAAPEQHGCYVRYRLTTPDAMLQVAGFYRTQAANAGVKLLDDSNMKFPAYRMLTFVTQPKLMDVVMGIEGGHTVVRVSFKTDDSGCP